MAFIGFLVFWAISFLAGQLLRAAIKPQKPPKGEVEVPTSEEGGQIPAIFGTVKIAPNTLWFGDVKVTPVKKRVKTGLFTSQNQTIGYRYWVGMQGGLCWGPVDALVDVILADKINVSEIPATSERIDIGPQFDPLQIDYAGISPSLPIAQSDGTAVVFSAPFVYGGMDREGGVVGTVRFYFGTTGQSANTYLGTKAPAIAGVAYKGLCYFVWEQIITGQTQYLKPWHFVLRRCPGVLAAIAGDSALARIGDDANPAEVLYELLTNTRWGLGRPSTDYDTASFLAALQTLATEGLGISGTHLGATNADEAVKKILATIDGVLVPDPVTGAIRLALIRADYAVEDLETFDASNSSALEYSRPDTPELSTEIKVRYTDAGQGFTTRVRPAYNPAVRQATGRSNPVFVDYPLVTTGANAEALAVRDLKALSSTLATGSIILTRAGAFLAPGDPFVIDYADDGLASTVVRATRVNPGSPHGTEDVEIQWTEDVFGVQGGVFTTDPTETFTPPTPPTFGSVQVTPEFTLSDTEGCVTLRITGRVDAIGTIEMRRQQGGESVEAWVAFAVDDPPLLCVDRDDIDTGVIAWRVEVLDPDGSTDTIEDEQAVPPLGVEGDPGVGAGTPGNLLLPFVVESGDGSLVLGAHESPLEDVPSAFIRMNLAAGAQARGQATVVASGTPQSYLDVKYSLDDGLTWPDEQVFGLRVPMRDVKHAVGLAVALPQDAVGDVLMRAACAGGDGEAVPKILNFLVLVTSAAQPPADGEDEPTPPPGEGTLPEGGDFGDIVLHHDAFAIVGAADDDPQSTITDLTGNGHNGSLAGFQTAPVYKANGLGSGYPSLRTNGVNQGHKYTRPVSGAFALYVVYGNATGAGSSGFAFGNGSFESNHESPSGQDYKVTMRADGKFVQAISGSDVVAGVETSTTTGAYGGAGAHIYCLTRNPGIYDVQVDDTLEISGRSSDGLPMASNANVYYGAGGATLAMAADFGERVYFNAYHGPTERAAVIAVLKGKWGMP